MPCQHLQELFDLCKKHDLHIAGRDAVKIVCRQCEQQEVCPSSLTDGEQVITEIRQPMASRTTDTKTVSGDS
ncbi:hypothetical protein FF011L_06090 [Roseimaritima multifibrata]|uniref:Uncharacterized protein n=1 Tax=Roseimaritima multifibrata TaxID=1930274 RepID=A0A517MAG0_9BACT|nr:hypothetical protein [Roseimaritima multifibrata]QDS91873.1 hypothetical protein FF011L_06090 [Roseimaritima multifibrata]